MFRYREKALSNYASNAIMNAEDSKNLPPLKHDCSFQEVEIFYGDYSDTPHLYWSKGEWNIVKQSHLEQEDADIRQIRIDNNWVHIQVGNNVLLNRLNGINLPNF